LPADSRVPVPGRILVLALSALALGGPVPAAAQEQVPVPRAAEESTATGPAVSFFSSTDLLSAWIWRGWVLHDGFAIQPAHGLSACGFTVSSWFNFASGDWAVTEHDLTVEYGRDVGAARLSAGWIHYYFPGAESNRFTQEIYAGIAWLVPLQPGVTVYRDVQAGTGTYVVASVSHDVPMWDGRATLTTGASIGYNHRLWIDASTFSDVAISLQLALPRAGRVSLTPAVMWSRALDRTHFDTKIAWGLNVTVE